MHHRLLSILNPAYEPCQAFAAACREMRWDPTSGNVPRGFRGASGDVGEVELVLVFAEPGDPYEGEHYPDLRSATDYWQFVERRAAGRESSNCADADRFQRNKQLLLEMCWPDLSPSDRMRRVWMTESVLCSARVEGGPVPVRVSDECAGRYLLPQLRLLPGALVAALGSKAATRLRRVGWRDFVSAVSLAPPGCNRREARDSWANVADIVRTRRRHSAPVTARLVKKSTV